jgi:hypothetical protein
MTLYVLAVEALGYLFALTVGQRLIKGIPLLESEIGYLVNGHFSDDLIPDNP